MKTVDFYFAIGSRYSYLAATQVGSLEKETQTQIDWWPLDSTALLRARGSTPFAGEPVSGQYAWGYRELDARRWAELYGVAFREPNNRVRFDPAQLAVAATVAKRFDKVVEYSHTLFAAMFVDPLSQIDERELIGRAESCGIAADRFEKYLNDPEIAADLLATQERALRAGVFGVPSFVVDGELFWGNDRLVLLRAHLSRRRQLSPGSP